MLFATGGTAPADGSLAYPLESETVVAEDGMLILPPGAMQPSDPNAYLMADPPPVVVEQQLFANGLVVPAGYQCPTEGHCQTPCVACRQAQYVGWSLNVDLLVFEPYYADASSTLVHDDDATEGTLGLRLTFGHENSSGGGMEFRFSGTDFDELGILDSGAPNTLQPGEIQTFQFDFDLTQRIWIGDSSIVFGVGPRAASLMHRFGADPEVRANAGGLGLSATLYRPFWRSEKCQFAAIGFGRGSLMGGEIVNADDQLLADGTLSVLEAGFGLEMRRQWGRGDFVGRLLFESQWWESNLMQPIYFDGLSFRLGYQW
ncbi:hypothetical protein [Botrimarina colliarenosi]|uniref:hypothetical protein n=1 Tax=Botrimarina colliarenosi TaxID=2528001 RepID=UPI0011B79E98|nr:hypothetical protein [Botrimarina colliarenosi]